MLKYPCHAVSRKWQLSTRSLRLESRAEVKGGWECHIGDWTMWKYSTQVQCVTTQIMLHGWLDLHRVHRALKDLFIFSACQTLGLFIPMVVRMADPSHQDEYWRSYRNKQAEWTPMPCRNWTHLSVFIVNALHQWEVTLTWNFINFSINIFNLMLLASYFLGFTNGLH